MRCQWGGRSDTSPHPSHIPLIQPWSPLRTPTVRVENEPKGGTPTSHPGKQTQRKGFKGSTLAHKCHYKGKGSSYQEKEKGKGPAKHEWKRSFVIVAEAAKKAYQWRAEASHCGRQRGRRWGTRFSALRASSAASFRSSSLSTATFIRRPESIKPVSYESVNKDRSCGSFCS